MVVYVLDREGNPLMPTKRTAWVAYALKHGEAKVVRREPFTIQLLRDSTRYRQAVTLGVDVGSRHIGLSASTEKEELYSAQVEIRDDVSGLLEERSKLRRGRRGRKHNWYRPARWANRAKGRGWAALPPSIRHKADSHVRAVQFVAKMLPISRIRVELGKFDIQKIQNPDIQGEQYQQGTLAGWENLKAYAKYRDGYKCRACGKSKHEDGVRLEVHHIIRKTDGGTDVPENVVTLCEACHKDHHQGAKKLKFRRTPQHKSEAHMNAMRHCLFEGIVWYFGHLDIKATYGYETAMARRAHGIEKSHANDAFCIAGNFGAERNIYNVYLHKFVRRHNRKLHKTTIIKGGIRKANQCAKEVFGYRLNDRVRYAGKDWFVHSRRTRGSFLLGNLTMTEKAEVSRRKIRLIHRVGTQLTERRGWNRLRKDCKREKRVMQKLKRSECSILPLVLKGKWYDMIDSGVKTEEYREAKPFWRKRISNWVERYGEIGPRGRLVVAFSRGYRNPDMFFLCVGTNVYPDSLHPDWGEPKGPHHVIVLGKRIELED